MSNEDIKEVVSEVIKHLEHKCLRETDIALIKQDINYIRLTLDEMNTDSKVKTWIAFGGSVLAATLISIGIGKLK